MWLLLLAAISAYNLLLLHGVDESPWSSYFRTRLWLWRILGAIVISLMDYMGTGKFWYLFATRGIGFF